MVQVVWSPEALDQLELIRGYVERFSPAAAGRLVERLLSAGESLADFPHRGRPARFGTRELPTIPPYILVYEVDPRRVLILTVRHGRQRPAEE